MWLLLLALGLFGIAVRRQQELRAMALPPIEYPELTAQAPTFFENLLPLTPVAPRPRPRSPSAPSIPGKPAIYRPLRLLDEEEFIELTQRPGGEPETLVPSPAGGDWSVTGFPELSQVPRPDWQQPRLEGGYRPERGGEGGVIIVPPYTSPDTPIDLPRPPNPDSTWPGPIPPPDFPSGPISPAPEPPPVIAPPPPPPEPPPPIYEPPLPADSGAVVV